MNVFFGDTFDFNGDGHLDSFERAADMGMFIQMVEDGQEEESFDDFNMDDEF